MLETHQVIRTEFETIDVDSRVSSLCLVVDVTHASTELVKLKEYQLKFNYLYLLHIVILTNQVFNVYGVLKWLKFWSAFSGPNIWIELVRYCKKLSEIYCKS